MDPILKWAGGKRKLIPSISKHLNIEELEGHTLYEPFIGGGALSFNLLYNRVVINDLNDELINVYIQIKNNPVELVKFLKQHKKNNSKEYYYFIRNLDRTPEFLTMSDVQKAARTIYLNRVCYNGLYRVNSKGQFNVPYGRYVHPEIVFEDKIYELNGYLNNNEVNIMHGDFEIAVQSAQKGDVIYFDPPYDYENDGFTSYTKNGFSREDLKRLKLICDDLIKRGCKVIISNNDTTFVNDLFSDIHYTIEHIYASRMINCKGKKRKAAKEVIIYG